MSPQLKNLSELVEQVRARIRTHRLLRGLFITFCVAAATLFAAVAMADLASHRPVILNALRVSPLLVSALAAWLAIVRPLRSTISDHQIARLVEEKCRLSDRLVTAVEYGSDARDASPAIVDRLIRETSERCYRISLDQLVDPRRHYIYGSAAAAVFLTTIVALFIGPASMQEGFTSLYSPLGRAVSADAMFIKVSPGTARAPRGSDQKLKASLNGFDSESAQVFIRRFGTENWVAYRMEPAKSYGEFQYVIFNIQDSVTYYVESGGVRSPEFTLEVADLPFVKQIDLVLNFPAYTRLANKRIENGGEIATLKGTVVTLSAHLSGEAKGARIVLGDGRVVEMAAGEDSQFMGQFPVTANGTYKIEITSLDGERYNGSNEYDITVLEDHAPTVVIEKPGRDMKVSQIQEVFSQARAEDDYGVTSLEFYFSVNGGEERQVKLQDLKNDTPRTLSGAHTFFLEEFSLQPGDFISYYAKARDNGASGGRESTSDIYFLEVRPFDREFRQAQQQGGGGSGDQESNALTRRQREIIAATFRMQRELADYTPEEKEQSFDAVTLSQEKLKTDAEALAERIRRRFGDQLSSQPDFAKLVEYITQAAKEMVSATGELRSRKTKEALPPSSARFNSCSAPKQSSARCR